MTGFDSKRKASLDTLDQLPYQARESRPEELAQANPWREAINDELICLHLGTADSFPDAGAALNAVVNWHVETALDPEVSAYAQALIDRGAAAPVPEDDMDDDDGCPVCGADGGTSCGMPNCGLLSAAPTVQSAKDIADEQSYDPGLWFVAETATEAHLQAALRRLTAAVEGEAPVALTPMSYEQIWMLATQCTIGGDLHIDKFARAVEAAHGIKGETL
jgi:hypothetical protein